MFPALVIYSISYFLIPLIRYIINTRQNQEIQIRNERRLNWEKTVKSDQFQRKFNAACQVAFEMTAENNKKKNIKNGQDNIIYSTKEPLNK